MDDHLHCFGRDQQVVRLLLYAPFRHVPCGLGDRPGSIAIRDRRAEGGSDANQIGREDVEADLGLVAACDRYSVARGGVACQGIYGGKAGEIDGCGGFDEEEDTEGGGSEIFHKVPAERHCSTEPCPGERRSPKSTKNVDVGRGDAGARRRGDPGYRMLDEEWMNKAIWRQATPLILQHRQCLSLARDAKHAKKAPMRISPSGSGY